MYVCAAFLQPYNAMGSSFPYIVIERTTVRGLYVWFSLCVAASKRGEGLSHIYA